MQIFSHNHYCDQLTSTYQHISHYHHMLCVQDCVITIIHDWAVCTISYQKYLVYKQLGKKFEQWRLENAYTAYLLKNTIRLTFVSSSRQYTCQKYLVKSSFPIGCPMILIRSLTCTKWGELKRECKKKTKIHNKDNTVNVMTLLQCLFKPLKVLLWTMVSDYVNH